MPRAGRKVAMIFLSAGAMAHLLKENGLSQAGLFDVYVASALCRDILILCPEAWENWLDRKMKEAWRVMKNKLGGVCERIWRKPRRGTIATVAVQV